MLRLLLLGLLLQNVPPIGSRGGVLMGEVRLSNGLPAIGVRVAALEAPVLADGDPANASVLAGLAMTDETGRFRLEDIAPGRYFIVAGNLNNLVYRPTPVLVAAGASIDGLNFSMSEAYEGVVEVFVHVTGTSQPVPGAVVNLRPPTSQTATYLQMQGVVAPAGNRTGATNIDGVAAFSGIPYGDYLVSTPAQSLREILSGVPAQTATPRELSVSVSINPDRPRWRVSLGIQRPGEVRGTVRDSSGRPVVDALVETTTIGYRNGREILVTESSVRTDRFGEYVLPTAQGERYIRAVPPDTSLGEGVSYFPSTGDPGNAKSVVVPSGQEVTADITLAKTYALSGRVVTGETDPVISGLVLAPRNGPDVLIAVLPNTSVTGGGRFEVRGIPAGLWDVFPVVELQSGAVQTSRLSIDVSDKALDNLSMTIRTGSIQGRVSVTGTADPSRLDLADLRVSLIPRDGIPVQLLDAVPEPQAPDRNGNFAFSNVSRFKYGFQVNGLLLGWFVSDIRTGGVSIINSNSVGVDGGDPLQVEILLSPSGGRIEGTVAGVAGNPQLVLNSHVVLVPEDARRENFLGYRTASVGPDGGFTIVPSVAPGNYKIFAVTRLPGGKPELNAEFLSKYEDAAVPVTVEANETVRRDLQLIPAR